MEMIVISCIGSMRGIHNSVGLGKCKNDKTNMGILYLKKTVQFIPTFPVYLCDRPNLLI